MLFSQCIVSLPDASQGICQCSGILHNIAGYAAAQSMLAAAQIWFLNHSMSPLRRLCAAKQGG